MRLPFYIAFFSFLGTLVLAAPVEPAAGDLVNRDGVVCNQAPNFGLTASGQGGCSGSSTNITGVTPGDLGDIASKVGPLK